MGFQYRLWGSGLKLKHFEFRFGHQWCAAALSAAATSIRCIVRLPRISVVLVLTVPVVALASIAYR